MDEGGRLIGAGTRSLGTRRVSRRVLSSLQSASAALRLSAGSAHESAQRARAARAVSLCVISEASSRMAASCLSALSSAWVSGDWAQVRSWVRVSPWRAARDGRGRASPRKSRRRDWGPAIGDWGCGPGVGCGWSREEAEEELFESPTSVGEEEGGVGAGVGGGGWVLVCGRVGGGSDGEDGRGGSPSPRPSPPGGEGGGDWFSKRAREKSSRMGLVFRRRAGVVLWRVVCVVFIPVIVGMAGAGAMGRLGWDGCLRAPVGFGGGLGVGGVRAKAIEEFGIGCAWRAPLRRGAASRGTRSVEALWRLGSL